METVAAGGWLRVLSGLVDSGMFSRQFLIRFSVLWIVLITVGSFLPTRAKVALGTTTDFNSAVIQHRVKPEHRLAHFGAFGIAALSLAVIAETLSQRVGALAGVLALALVIELLQKALHGGPVEYWDVRDDTLAALAGSALGTWQLVRAVLLRPY